MLTSNQLTRHCSTGCVYVCVCVSVCMCAMLACVANAQIPSRKSNQTVQASGQRRRATTTSEKKGGSQKFAYNTNETLWQMQLKLEMETEQ